MRDILKIFRRFLPRYKKDMFLNIIFNFFGALFGVFSFISMIPVLRILFKLEDKVYQFLPVDFSSMTLKEFGKAIENNLYAYLSQIIQMHSATRALIYLGLFLILMVLFKTGFTYFASFFMVNIRNGVVRDIRNDIYRKAVSLPISFFTEERKGDIISRMTGDVVEIEVSVMHSLEMLFKNPVIILVSVITMIIMSWQLSLFVFLLFPVAGIIIGRIGRSLKKSSLAGQNKMGEILSTIEETLSGLRIIKAFNAESKMRTRFSLETESYRHIMNRLMRRNFLAHPVSEFLGTAVIVIVMWFGGNLILNDVSSLDAEEFLVYLVVFYSIINPTKAFSQAFYNVQKGLASLERIDKVLNAISNIVEKPDARPVTQFEHAITYKDVHFRYKKEWVLRYVDLEINKGKTIALVGQSGSGKSTLVDLLPRFYDVVKGEILLDGINIKDYKIHDLRGLMGIVNQDPILFNDSFFNNIAFGIDDATEEEVISAARVANAHEFIMNTENGYHTNIGDRGSKLSGGQRQRISIARAVLKNPPVLILDEATSALDTESERLVQEALTNLMKNRTSVIIAHRLSTIVHADEICVINHGKIVERGKHEELIKLDGEYKKYYEMQSFS
jgi:subfamily B ATP-binding cassette protein MsbA